MVEKVVHKNLNTGTWIVSALAGNVGKGLKERDVDAIVLHQVRFNVQRAAAAKIKAGAHRNVHAWSIGTVVENPPAFGRGVEVTYNPKRRDDFHTRDGRTVVACEWLRFGADGVVTAFGKIRLG